MVVLRKGTTGEIAGEHEVTSTTGTRRGLGVLLIRLENRFIKAFRRGQVNNFAQLTMAYLAGFVTHPQSVELVDEIAFSSLDNKLGEDPSSV